MEHEHFIISYRYTREANYSSAMAHFCVKSKEWIEQNIPMIMYDPQVLQFINSTSYRMHLACGETIYEVNGQWQRITHKAIVENG